MENINADNFMELLLDLGACSNAVRWARGKDFVTVWTTCERADWLLWLCGKMVDKQGWPTRKQVVLAACACAETALKYVPANEDRPRKCIEIVRAWAQGEATLDQVCTARRAAAADAAAAYAAAAYAAAAYAAAAYAADVAYAADAAAAAAALKEMCQLVRNTLNITFEAGVS